MNRIESRQNPKIKHLRRLGADPALRRREGLYLCDGIKLLDDALGCRTPIVTLLVRDGLVLPPLPSQTRVYRCPKEIIDAVSPSRTPQGVVFTVPLPPAPDAPPECGRFLLLHGLQDPGNVGAILRSAEAFGLSGVYLTEDCADPFGPKAVRAGMGAQFRLPVGMTAPQVLLEGRLPLRAAAVTADAYPVTTLAGWEGIVALGNEGNGLPQTLLDRADGHVTIPMPGGAESLGVAAAAAIICYHLSQEYQ